MSVAKEHREALNQFVEINGLSEKSRLYRYTAKHYLKIENGIHYLIAKNDSTDMAIDNYHDKGYVFISKEFGKGLSFLSKPEPDYEKEGRVCVNIELNDVFSQGGLIYEITSLPAYLKGYYVTIPEGKIRVNLET